MQSTGVYWIPLYDVLEEEGFEVYLVNARDTKNLPGRKSDVDRALSPAWLCDPTDRSERSQATRELS